MIRSGKSSSGRRQRPRHAWHVRQAAFKDLKDPPWQVLREQAKTISHELQAILDEFEDVTS